MWPHETFRGVGFADGVMEAAGSLGNGDDEDEIEEELERCRRAVGLVR